MTMPNFLIIGAMKAGTSSLYRYMKQHPQVYLSPIKEPYFFAIEDETNSSNSITKAKEYCVDNIEVYRTLFEGVSNETAIGEASTFYLYSPKAPERIQHYVPDVKLIAMLRDPAQRAYSHFLNMVRQGFEPITDFAQAIREEETRARNDLSWAYYVRLGFYYTQLQRYFDRFDRDQIKVYLYEDWNANPSGVLQDIFQFLSINDTFVPDMSTKYNVSGIPKNKTLHALFNNLKQLEFILEPFIPKQVHQRLVRMGVSLKNRNLFKPQLTPELRSQLIEVYREDILKLQDLIQRDLSNWLK